MLSSINIIREKGLVWEGKTIKLVAEICRMKMNN